MDRVLVTGSTGFIGSHLCKALHERGYAVRAFHRPASPLTLLEGIDVEHAVGDITKPESLEKALHGVDLVFHTASQLGRASLDQMKAVTVTGTRNVLLASIRAGVRKVIYTSSVAALGMPVKAAYDHNSLLIDENHTWNYRPAWWPYGYTKYLAELEVQQAVSQNLDTVILNPTVVIGAGDLNRVSGYVIIRTARSFKLIAPAGGLNVIHIDDVVRGHLLALENGRTGERYILGNQNLTHLQFRQAVADVAGVSPPRWVEPARLMHGLAWPVSYLEKWLTLPVNSNSLRQSGYFFYYDNRKATRELGLINLLPAHQAIEEAYEWYRKWRYL